MNNDYSIILQMMKYFVRLRNLVKIMMKEQENRRGKNVYHIAETKICIYNSSISFKVLFWKLPYI